MCVLLRFVVRCRSKEAEPAEKFVIIIVVNILICIIMPMIYITVVLTYSDVIIKQ